MFSNFFGGKRNTVSGSKGKENEKEEKSSLKNSGSNTLPKPVNNYSNSSNNESGNNFINSPSALSPLVSSPPPSTSISPLSTTPSTTSPQLNSISQQQPTSASASSTTTTTSHQGVITSLQMKPSCTNLTDDIEKKKQAKYDSSLEQTARKWVSDVLEIELLDENKTFFELFKNGVLLCKLVNKLRPNLIKKINESTISFKCLENIENYLKACIALGLQSVNLFNSIDLFENKDITLVITNIVVLGKHASKIDSYNGPHLAGEKKIIKITTTPVSPLFTPSSSNNNNNNTNSNNTNTNHLNGNLSPTSSNGASITSAGNPLNKSTNGQRKAKWRKSVKIPAVSSLNTDIRTKEAFKFSPELQKAAQDWIEQVTNEKFKLPSFSSSLKDGILLCKVINKIIPNTILYINNGNSSFKKMENIGNYLKGCLVVGLKKTDLFDTPDLFEEKNINFVISNIHVLANHVNKFYSNLKLPNIKKETQIGGNGNGNNSNNSPLKMYSSIIHSKFGNSGGEGGTSTVVIPEDLKDLKDWINQHLRAHHSLQIGNDMSNDLRNGVTLLTLLEELTLQKVGIFTREPVLPWHFMQNICLLLNFLRENSVHNVSDISAHDLFNGDIGSLCNIIRLIRDHFDRDHLFKSIPMDTRRQKVIEEIISTEQSYVKSLSTVYNSLIAPLQNSLDTLSPILTADEIFSIFGNWEHLLRSHIKLLKEFKTKLNLPITSNFDDTSNLFGGENLTINSNITIGDIFLEKCEFLKENYTSYINNYDNSYQRVKRLRKGNSVFEELVNTFEIFQDSNNGLDLYSYLIMPIQRIVRYILLLKELIKYTPNSHADYQMLQNAKENIKRIADHVNESKMAVENKRKISSIQDSIQSLPFNLMDKERTYIREGFLEIEDTFKKDSYFFLFSDILLFVKYKPSEETGKEFKYKEVFYLDQVVDVSDILSDDEDDNNYDENVEHQVDENNNNNCNNSNSENNVEVAAVVEEEDQILRRSCNSNSNSKSNTSEPIYSFEIETNEFSLVLLAESHTEKIEWMEDLRSCLQHQLIQEEDQLSSLSISDNADDVDDDDLNENCNSIDNNNNNNNCNLSNSIDNNINNNEEEEEEEEEDVDNSQQQQQQQEEEQNNNNNITTNKQNRASVTFKTHRRLESEDTISDTESDDYELAVGRFKKAPPPQRKITFSDHIETINQENE